MALDKEFIYKDDLDKAKSEIKPEEIDAFYLDLYKNGRLLETGADTSDNLRAIRDYNKNLHLISSIIKENEALQRQVHSLGIKNRIKKKLGKYRPLETVRSPLPKSVLDDIRSGRFLTKNSLPEIMSSVKALSNFRKKRGQPFEKGIYQLQETIKIPKPKKQPMVSIIIPTRNGIEHFKRLLPVFEKYAQYENYEIIVVDNASTDNTATYLQQFEKSLNLRIITNSTNKSFSETNNIGVDNASGEYLLFLNNDVLPTYGWLNHMVNTALKDKSIGAVGAKLIYPYKKDFMYSHKIQHGGIGFYLEEDFIRPININNGVSFMDANTAHEEEKIGVTAACLLVEKKKYLAVGGFDEDYWYGYEDVDLCLKLNDAGFKNVINNAAVLFHYEFGTQEKNSSTEITNYRKKNMRIFKNKWQTKIYTKYWDDLLGQKSLYTNKKLHFCFITTESNDTTAAGDLFTAKELGIALEKNGYEVSYIGVRNTPDPFAIDPEIDVIISMIDGYDISKITNKRALKIAWCRNWFERWAAHDYFRDFDITLTNSEKSQNLFRDELFIDSHLFKIATNKERFSENYGPLELEKYKSDICFTGNYWHNPRDITELFDPTAFPKYQTKIFGKDWNVIKKFAPYHQGFILYQDIPKVYKAGKILIDDATWVVNEWGSVNSRVFDGAAAGVLVLSNGKTGADQTFNGLVPTFSTKQELDDLLKLYLSDDKLREAKIKELQSFVLKHHTYDERAKQLIEILKQTLTRNSVNIKMPIPRWSEAKQWGDLHFSLALKKQFEAKGLNANIQILPEWEQGEFAQANIVLRGLSVFNPTNHQTNIMWNISHPEKVPLDEYREYDYIFVASKLHADELSKKGLKNVYPLYQCSDEELFDKADSPTQENRSDILYVGNTRMIYRSAVKYLMTWDKLDNYNVKIYGQGWSKFIDKKYIAGDHISNNELKNYYANSKIILNDHWEDMNKYGFASNRLFDASAVGGFIISDKNQGIDDIFGAGLIPQYNDEASLHGLLDKYIDDDKSRSSTASKANLIVLKNHTFKQRAEAIINTVRELQ